MWRSVSIGNKEWGVPAYDGAIFSIDSSVSKAGAALDEIKQKYGSVENFIRDELKIRDESIIELKNFLLTES